MLALSRRRVLIGALATHLAGPVWAQQLGSSPEQIDTDTLAAYLDVLLPADDLTPAASAIAVHTDIAEFADKAPLFRKLLSVGTQWLNQTGRGAFHTLSLRDQERVVAWMSTADRAQIPGRFFLLVRLTGMEFYYANPKANVGFDLNRAPQPAGYLPPWQ